MKLTGGQIADAVLSRTIPGNPPSEGALTRLIANVNALPAGKHKFVPLFKLQEVARKLTPIAQNLSEQFNAAIKANDVESTKSLLETESEVDIEPISVELFADVDPDPDVIPLLWWLFKE